MRTRRIQQAGYSLTELLIVVAMIGIIALVTIPALTQLMPQYRIRSAASEAAATFRFVRAKAISTRTPWRLSFDPSGNRYGISMLANPNDARDEPGNWVPMRFDGGKDTGSAGAPSEKWWIRTSAVDLQTATTNPFKDVDDDALKMVDLVFLRDGSVATDPSYGGSDTLKFLTDTPPAAAAPSVVFAVPTRRVRFNRYEISVDNHGKVTITPSKV